VFGNTCAGIMEGPEVPGGNSGPPRDTAALGATFSNRDMAQEGQHHAANDLRHELQGMLNTHMQEVLAKLDAHKNNIHVELRTFASRLQSMEGEIVDLRGSNSNKAGRKPLMVGGLTSKEVFERLRAEMRQEIEIVSIKAGYLAVAASACDDMEKQRVFQTLKAKEQALKDSAANALELVPSSPMSTPKQSPNASRSESRSRPFATHSCYGAAGLSGSRDGIEQRFDFEIQLDRSSNKALGVTIDGDNDRGRSLLVETVKQGLVQDWNETCLPDQVVRPGDVIVAVNGEEGDSARMLAEAGTGRQLRLRVCRAGGAGGLPSRNEGVAAERKGSYSDRSYEKF